MIELKNEQLTILVAENGAELQSVKDVDGREYMWQAGPEWSRHSPILFPIVCSVNNGTYVVDGREYHLPRHGFARDALFTVVSQTTQKVTLALHESEDTLHVYPYCFNLGITYKLEGNKIQVIWHVENTDCREIHFQIGGHPAFNVPGGKLEGRIKLDNEAPMTTLKSYPDGSHDMEEVPLEADMGIMEITSEFFRNDSVKIHKCQTHRAMLVDTDGEPAVTVDYQAPVCAFWSPYGKEAPFVCIEPWYGIGDPRGFSGEFKDKPLMNHLLPGASFMSRYTITIG
ncbi:MAG: aldose 1-epimerase family protein [Bacteroidaceae bacterium]|nr:aldose 1-epimerase family protein [Bacteroidaceae bacterium]